MELVRNENEDGGDQNGSNDRIYYLHANAIRHSLNNHIYIYIKLLI